MKKQLTHGLVALNNSWLPNSGLWVVNLSTATAACTEIRYADQNMTRRTWNFSPSNLCAMHCSSLTVDLQNWASDARNVCRSQPWRQQKNSRWCKQDAYRPLRPDSFRADWRQYCFVWPTAHD